MWYVLFAAALFTVLVPAATADSDTGDDETADDDVTAFTSDYGARVRLLQLEESITRNILWGREIVEKIKELNESADTSELEAILAELETLRDEVAGTTPAAGEEGAKEFVDMKSDAINLTREFRDAVRELLSPGDIQGLRKRLGDIESEGLKNLRKEIREAIRNYNAERIAEILEEAGIDDPQLIEAIRAGNATRQEVAEALREANAGKGKAFRLAYVLKEKKQKANVFMEAVRAKVKLNQTERIQSRIQVRLEQAGKKVNLSVKAAEKIQERIQSNERKLERLEEKLQEKTGDNGTGKRGQGA